MSNECSTIVWKRDFGNSNRKVIAARLADHADDEGRGIWPSVERIAAQCNVSDRTVQRVLASFVSEGVLVLVDEGGRGPRSTRRYDFDMGVVSALPMAQWGPENLQNKGDTVSPLENGKGDSQSPKGDNPDEKGCHGVTQTTIEPPVEPSPEREARERGQEDRKAVERSFERAWQAWPTSVSDSRPAALKAWLALSQPERESAFAEMARWLEANRTSGRKHVPAFGSYLADKRWENLPPAQDPEKPLNVEAKPFGPWWMAARLKCLLRGPTMTPAGLTSFERSLVADGKADEGELMRAKIAKTGWPTINAMHDRAANRQGVTVATALEHLAAMMEAVPVGSEIYVGWRALHEAKGWPWLPDPGDQRVVYFPAGGPEALDAFEAAIRGNQNDAGGREAAE
jgi:hypothetical protein